MVVVFRRTGERRYAVEVRRAVFPDLEMNRRLVTTSLFRTT